MLQKNKLLFLVAIIQVLFFFGWYFLQSSKLHDPKAQTILVKTMPVDPRDYLSGNYLTLRYEFSDLWGFKNRSNYAATAPNQEIYVILKKDGVWHVPDYVSLTKPSVRDDQVAIKGKYVGIGGRIEYGIEKYFINENTKEPSRQDKVEVVLVVGKDMTPVIKKLMVNGAEFTN